MGRRDMAAQSTRQRARDTRRRRRKRRVLRGLGRLLFWTFVLAGVFVLGIGFGRTIGGSGGEAGPGQVTVTADRGQLTATLPTRTIVETRTVTRTVRVRQKRARR